MHTVHPTYLPSDISLPSPPTMPCIVQLSGDGEKMCMCYTTRKKCGLIAAAKRMQAEGRPMRDAAAELRVSSANLLRWARQGYSEIDHLDKILRSKKKTALTGPVSQLKMIEGALLHYNFKLHEQGVMVNTFMVTLRAS